MKRKRLEQAGLHAVRLLRFNKLQQGLPFMINTSLLPPDHCYYEYPDGSISLVTICKINGDFKEVHKLTKEENQEIRGKLNLAILK